MQLGISKSIQKRKKESALIMRKQTKLVAVLSAAALLAIGASMTSFAATGWAEEDGTWVYYDRDGERVTDEWKKSGNNWFYLDEDGYMATDYLVEDDDDYYYVDENGVMVTNRWISIENEDKDDDEDPDNWWYYFGSNGKAYKKSDNYTSTTSVPTKTINGKKYTFDEEGKMQFGWVNSDGRQTDDDAWQSCDYYFGDENDGAMSVGWREIHIIDEGWEGEQPNDDIWDEDQDRWFWFKSSGKKEKGTEEKAKINKNIGGKKYGFDQYGRMIAEWYTTASPVKSKASSATASDGQGGSEYSNGFMYFNSPESGARYTKGWFKVVPGYYLQTDKYEDGDDFWYYADGNGNIVANEIKTINSKKYLFDKYGRMKSGLIFVTMDDNETTGAISNNKIVDTWAKDSEDKDKGRYDSESDYYDFVNLHAEDVVSGRIRSYYFGDSNDGSMKTGKQTIDIDGDSFTFEFEKSGSKKGSGKTGYSSSDDKLYMAGMVVKADKDNKYEIWMVDTNEEDPEIREVEMDEFLGLCGDPEENKDGDYTWKASLNAGTVKYYLINTSGKVIDSKSKAKNGDDYKITVEKGVITEVLLEN